MRKLGDDYVRSEFRAHKTAKAEQVTQFVNAWSDYLLKIRLQKERFGSNLNDNTQKALSDEQKKKLDELKSEARNSFKEQPAEA
jgi:aspartate carbamoyltransferase catalytic subunit